MSSNRTRVLRHPAVVDIGCGCGRPKLYSLFSSTSTSKIFKRSSPPSSATTSHRWETNLTSTTTTTTTSSSHEEDNTSTSSTSVTDIVMRRKKRNKVEESVAVVKESLEPYIDFRDSMLNMIVEKELYEWEDFQDLLHRLLELNCPQHHHIILRAFADVCNSLFAGPPSMIGGVDGTSTQPGASGS